VSFPRYESYKDSGVEWLGDVPEYWQIIQLKRLATIQNGRDYKHIETNDNDGYPVIGSGGEFARATEYLFTGESVLLGRKGTIDKPLYINGSFWVVDTMFYTVVNKEAVPKYLYYCALTIRFDLYSTSTAVPSMTQNDLGSIYFAVPDIAEQQTIAAFLDRETAKIDALIAEQQRLIELLKEKRQAVISHAVTKGLNPNAPMKDSGIEWLGEVPKHWEICKVRRRLNEHRQGYYSTDSYVDAGIRLLRITDLREFGRIDYSESPFVEVKGEVSVFLLQESDFVFARTGGAGTFGVVEVLYEPVAYASYLIRFRFSATLFTNFLRYFFLSDCFQNAVRQNIHGGVNQNIHAEDIKNQYLAVPSLNEQQTIAAFLDSETTKLNTLTTEAKTAITLLQERRTALISAAVTGKIDVRDLVFPA
jgi:type I restriction enzyme S subunit